MQKFNFKVVLLTLGCTVLNLSLFAQQNKLAKGWEAFNQNNRAEALQYFQEAAAEPSTQAMASLDQCLVDYNNQKPVAAFQQFLKFYKTAENPYPYIYALWASPFLAGDNGTDNEQERLDFFKKLASDPKANLTLKGMAYSYIGNYYQGENDYKQAREAYKELNILDQWTITGTFDNVSGSGFNKDFGPLEHPEANAEFKNDADATVKWFPVTYFRNDRWFDFTYNFLTDNSIVYAQTFVRSEKDQDALLMSGVSGSVKIWVNDKLVTSIEEERNTGMDVYNSTIRLNKGYNRILIQIGSSEVNASNFMIRLADRSGHYLQSISCTNAYQPYEKAQDYVSESVPFFAEQYFRDKLKANPDDIVSEFMLVEIYLHNEKSFEARKILDHIRLQAPKSSYASLKLIEAYKIDNNKTDLTKEQEFLKKTDPDNYQSLLLSWGDAIQKEDYTAAGQIYTKLTGMYDENEAITLMRLAVEGKKNDVDSFLKDLNSSYAKYPDNYYFAKAKYFMELNASKDLKKANGIIERYLKHNSSYEFRQMLINNYFKLGDKSKAEACMNESMLNLPYSTGDFSKFAGIYYDMQDYPTALAWEQKALKQAPYIGSYYNTTGNIYEAMNRKEEAINAYKKCIYYDPTDYDARKKLRELENKKDLFDYISPLKPDSIYEQAPESSAYPNDNSIVLLDDKQRVVYGQGASEEKATLLVKVFNQAGIDDWKECRVDYNPYSQRLIIENAEVLKKDGSKVKAESNDGDMVFTSLEAGDAITYTYRLENYNSGRLARHFWDDFNFNYFVPVLNARYSLVLPEDQQVYYKVINATLTPEIKAKDGFKRYTWQTSNNPAIQYEYYMPVLADVGKRLEVSSIPDWKFIAEWYSDLSSAKAKSDYEIKEVVADIFSNKPELTELEKAKLIYSYIVKHISYSDVSFLHSAFTPQRASRTLNTRLGDCKDVATLFVAMAKEVGLKANLILVDTRNNGDRHLLLPTINFNHCIASVEAEGKKYLVELTSPYLPFGALPSALRHTSGLYIPRDGQRFTDSLVKLNSATDIPSTIVRQTDVRFDDSEMDIKMHSIRTGSSAGGFRSSYATLGEKDQLKSMSASIGSGFKSNAQLSSLHFTNLDNLDDSVRYDVRFSVNDAISEVAGMSILKLPWTDAFNSLNFLSEDKRDFPFELWQMDLAEKSKETITLHVPGDKKLAEVPSDIHYSCGALTYTLSFKTKPGELIATREFQVNKDAVAPGDYEAFKAFFSKVANADSKQYGLK